MDRGAWRATVHGVTKRRTRLSDSCEQEGAGQEEEAALAEQPWSCPDSLFIPKVPKIVPFSQPRLLSTPRNSKYSQTWILHSPWNASLHPFHSSILSPVLRPTHSILPRTES